MQHMERESEGKKFGGKMTSKRMSGRSTGEKERQEIKSLPSREKRESFTPPPTRTMCVMILTE